MTVAGLGLHGGAIGTIEWLVLMGAIVTVTDLKSEEILAPSIKKLSHLSGITFVLGEHRDEDFTTADVVVRNPGMPMSSPFLQKALLAGVPITMDSGLFFDFCVSQDIIGVTGSKGKTTTSMAITEVVKALNPQTVAVGVDGVSPLRELSNILPDTPVVFELSSWRLEALVAIEKSPKLAIITSLYRDHLNTYDSFEEYIETKKHILRFQTPRDVAILNADDSRVRGLENFVKGTLYWYSISEPPSGEGIGVVGDMLTVYKDGVSVDLFPLDHLPFTTDHERRNCLPALLIGFLRGLTPSQLKESIKNLQRLPHRLELVRTLHDITYVNDSAATMPDATIVALESYKEHSIVHILGGSDKELLFEDLGKKLSETTIRALVFLPGGATERMKQVISSFVSKELPIVDATDMKDAVTKARSLAKPGDTVLLSPGATSFGLFLHEFDRGDTFREAVSALV